MTHDAVKKAWGEIDKTALDDRLAIGNLANWCLYSERQFLTLYGREMQGKTVLAQLLFNQVSALHSQQLDIPTPIYLNFEFVFDQAVAREENLSVNTRPLSLFQMAAIEVVRTTFRANTFGELPSYNQLFEPVVHRRGLVIVDNLERMFTNLNWKEDRQRAFFSSVVSSLRELDPKKSSKFLFMLRPESESASARALKVVSPLWLQLQDLQTTQ